MTAPRFRFRPPPVDDSPALRWTLAAAFAPCERLAPPPDASAALALADRLGLLPRIAARLAPERCANGELGDALRRERARGLAAELLHDATLAELAAAAEPAGAELAPLKGRALVVAGHASPGTRPSADLDVLVAPERLPDLHAALRARGWSAAGGGYEHQAPALRRTGAAPVELHRHLPGVRVAGGASATWTDLGAAGLLRALPAPGAPRALRLPADDVLVAHALAHALAQHGFHAAYPGWWLVADLVDLDAPTIGRADAPWRAWIARDVAGDEVDAALELARRVAAGEPALGTDPADHATLLARHFVSCAVSDDYRIALKRRWLASPLSDRPRWAARLDVLRGALVPPVRRHADGSPERGARRAVRWLARPFVLVGRAAEAVLAARRTRGPR